MDLINLSLAGLSAVGAVNVATFFKPDLKSEVKFALSFISALLIIALVPVDLGNIILEYVKQALVIAFAMSGTYKLVTKVGTI